jgi:hypothetical protein
LLPITSELRFLHNKPSGTQRSSFLSTFWLHSLLTQEGNPGLSELRLSIDLHLLPVILFSIPATVIKYVQQTTRGENDHLRQCFPKVHRLTREFAQCEPLWIELRFFTKESNLLAERPSGEQT